MSWNHEELCKRSVFLSFPRKRESSEGASAPVKFFVLAPQVKLDSRFHGNDNFLFNGV